MVKDDHVTYRTVKDSLAPIHGIMVGSVAGVLLWIVILIVLYEVL